MDMMEKIEKVLDEDVRPALESHGGNVIVNDMEAGTLYIRLTGMCSGCASASDTVHDIIFKNLNKRIPDIKEVVLEEGVSDELIEQAMKMLHHDK